MVERRYKVKIKKRVLKKVILTEEHHRRPRSLGGKNDPSNISYVLRRPHRSWHILFGNMNATQICNRVNSFPWKPKGVTVVCKFINGSECKKTGAQNSKKSGKCQEAWALLFKGLKFKSAIHYINNTWLDPSYRFYVIR